MVYLITNAVLERPIIYSLVKHSEKYSSLTSPCLQLQTFHMCKWFITLPTCSIIARQNTIQSCRKRGVTLGQWHRHPVQSVHINVETRHIKAGYIVFHHKVCCFLWIMDLLSPHWLYTHNCSYVLCWHIAYSCINCGFSLSQLCHNTL